MFESFTFQWHITNQCNSRCKHCYQEDFSDGGLSLENLKKISVNIKEFVKKLNFQYKKQITKHINITGGEPLQRKDLYEFIRILSPDFSIGILSNGTLIDDKAAQLIKQFKVKFVQLSLDGNKQIHDELRYNGSFDDTLKAISSLKKSGNFVTVSFTINNKNYSSIKEVISICKKNKVDKLWFDRYLPITVKDEDLRIRTEDFKGFLTNVLHSKKKYSNGMQISIERALQFLVGGNIPYQCKAGKNLLAILPDGSLLPCRRLPIIAGNLLYDDLFTLYDTNNTFLELRNSKNEITGCEKCLYQQSCNGGLKCLTFAVKNNYNEKDINCWI